MQSPVTIVLDLNQGSEYHTHQQSRQRHVSPANEVFKDRCFCKGLQPAAQQIESEKYESEVEPRLPSI
jgi:hypothetical protein